MWHGLVPDSEQFYIEVHSSVPDDALIAEIWAGIQLWGQVQEQDGAFTVKCWPNKITADGTWTVDLDQLVRILQRARTRLTGPDADASSQGEQP